MSTPAGDSPDGPGDDARSLNPAVGPDDDVAALLVVGVNHQSSSMALRDCVTLEDDALPAFLTRLPGHGVAQAVVLSTCDRVEVIACAGATDDEAVEVARLGALQALAEAGAVSPARIAAEGYVLRGEAAVRHCFAVAASLDSQVIGEPHVLRQVKAGYATARAAGLLGAELERLLQAAFATAKRVRTETAIAEGPVSVASAAVQVARDLHGELDRCHALLLGTGEMGELLAETFLAHGLNRLVTRGRRPGRAETVARRLGGHVSPHGALIDDLVPADIVICAYGGREHVLGVDAARQVAKRRRQRPVFIADVAVPGDVEPMVNTIGNAFLYDLDDLEGVAMRSRARRENEAEAAWAIVADEVARYRQGRAERAAVPAISLLRSHFEAERQRALAAAGGDADKATRLLVGRLLHAPTEELRRLAGGAPENLRHAENVARRLFRLSGAATPGAPHPPDPPDPFLSDDSEDT